MKISVDNTKPKPLWDYHKDGVTQSLLNLFRTCPEQCRLQYHQGWSHKYYSLPLHFGLCVHYVLAELYSEEISWPLNSYVKRKVMKFEELWEAEQKTPQDFQQEKLNEYVYSLADAILLEYFENYRDDFDHVWDFTEKNFEVPYKACNTILRGKMDGGFTYKDQKRVWLIDHKCLSVINFDNLSERLPFDTQCLLYCLAYKYMTGCYPAGIVYNIIRRPQSKPKQTEAINDFAKRIRETVEKKPEHYFMRIKLPIAPEELDRWEKEWLQPNLRVLESWYDRGCTGHTLNPDALEGKYGKAQMFNLIVKKTSFGYYRREHVFPELVSEF